MAGQSTHSFLQTAPVQPMLTRGFGNLHFLLSSMIGLHFPSVYPFYEKYALLIRVNLYRSLFQKLRAIGVVRKESKS